MFVVLKLLHIHVRLPSWDPEAYGAFLDSHCCRLVRNTIWSIKISLAFSAKLMQWSIYKWGKLAAAMPGTVGCEFKGGQLAFMNLSRWFLRPTSIMTCHKSLECRSQLVCPPIKYSHFYLLVWTLSEKSSLVLNSGHVTFLKSISFLKTLFIYSDMLLK